MINDNEVQLINWWKCNKCNLEDIGREASDGVIYRGQLALPRKEILDKEYNGNELWFIYAIYKKNLNTRPLYIFDRLSQYSFILRHWTHISENKCITWNQYNDYYDNFRHHGIWIFKYDESEIKRIRFKVLPKLNHV